jgi:hypothetical protein
MHGFDSDTGAANMRNPTSTAEAAIKTFSTEEARQLLDSGRPIQFWDVLTDEWFKGKRIAASRRVPWTRAEIK